MNKTKHFKRTALPKSAKSMVSFMLLLIAMLMPQGAWAANHYDAGYESTATTYSAAGIKFKITAVRMYNYQGNNSHFNSNPLVTITAGKHTHTFNLGSLTGESGNSIFYYNGEGNENPYKGSGSFSKRTYEQTVDGIPVKAYFDNQKNEQRVSTNPDKTYKDNGDGSSKWCTADLTIEIGVQTAATVTIEGNWRDESDGINKTESYSWSFDIPMHSHVYGSYSSNNDATCTDDGTKSRWCDYCGAEDKVTDTGSAFDHSYNTNGICIHDHSHYQPAPISGGYYLINNPGHLEWFAKYVNANAGSADGQWPINAKLTADIDLTGIQHTPIGTSEHPFYNSVFDGQGHTISNMKFINYDKGSLGLFGVASGTYDHDRTTICNFTITGEMTSQTSGLNYIAGVVGLAGYSITVRNVVNRVNITLGKNVVQHHIGGIAGNSSRIYVEDCINEGNIYAGNSDDCVAGIVAYTTGYTHIYNSLNVGSISSDNDNAFVGGILGYQNNNRFSGVLHCLNTGTIKGGNANTYAGAIYGYYRQPASNKGGNNYYLGSSAAKAYGKNESTDDLNALISEVTAEQVYNGYVAYRLNSGKTDGTQKWYQALGTGSNTIPSLVKNAANTVYELVHKKCDGTTPNGNITYTNNFTAQPTVEGHGLAEYTPTYTWEGTYATPTCTFTLKCNQCNTVVSTQNLTPTTVDANHVNATCVKAGNETWTVPAVSYSKTGDASYTGIAQTQDYTIPAGHIFDDNDPGQTYCTRCTHTFFRYTATEKVEPIKKDALMNSTGQGIYDKEKHTFDGKNGVMEFDEPLVTIGASAFWGCKVFTDDLIIPNTVTSIGNEAFYYCNSFNGTLTIPNSVTSIGRSAFYYCSRFKGNLIIPNSVTSIGDKAFAYCSGFTGNLSIPNTITSIGSSVFEECSGLTGNLTIPNTVTNIGDHAFSRCLGLTGTLTIPNTVTSIGDRAFAYCSFTGLTIPNTITSIRNGTFACCKGLTGTLTIPNSVTSIENNAFYECEGFAGIEFNSVPQIGGSDAFEYVTSNKTVVLSDDSNVYKGDNPYFPTVTSVTAPCSLDLTGSAVEKHLNLTRTGHSFTEKSDADAYLASAATCVNDATYFFKCANCTEHNSETWTKAGTRGHHYVDGHCSVCGDDLGPMTVTLGNGEVRKYNSLKQAIDDIVDFEMNDATLTLHQDLTIEGYKNIEIIFGEVGVDFNFTLDLNGHTITGGCEDNPNSFLINNSKSGLPTLTIANSCQDKKGKLFNFCLNLHDNTKVIVSEGVSIYPKFELLGIASEVIHFHSETSSLVNYGDIYGEVSTGSGGRFINNGRVASVFGEFEDYGDYCAYFNWADDGSSFSAYVYGSIRDYNEEDGNYSITSEVTKEPTCSEPGVRTFTGTFWEFTDTKEVEIPTLDHTFAASDITHDVCTVCNHGFLRYEADSQQNPYKAVNLKDKGDNTLTIESHTFNDHQGVMEFNAPLVKIGDLAFFFKQFTKITIPNTVEIIGATAFSSNRLLSAIEIPNSVKIIGSSAFADCIALTKITLGSSVEKINGYAFSCDEDQSDKDFDITLKSLPQFVNCDYPEIFHYKCIYYDEYVGCVGVEDRPIPANFELDDNSYVAPESSLGSSCIADHVTYTRTGIKNQWGTIVVPFEVNGSGDDYDLYTLSGVSNVELTLTKVSGTLAAGTPALIRLHDELAGNYDLTLTAANNAVSGQGTLQGSTADGITFTGSYGAKDITNENGFFIANNKFWNSADFTTKTVKTSPFRAYLKVSDSESLLHRLALDADGNGIIQAADINPIVTSILNDDSSYTVGYTTRVIDNIGKIVLHKGTTSDTDEPVSSNIWSE